MIESEYKDDCKFYGSNSNIPTIKSDDRSQLFNQDIEPIYDNSNHYFCTECLKFPFIKFCKDRRNIRLTCSCMNNKKILIEDLFKFENILIKKIIFLQQLNQIKAKIKLLKIILYAKNIKKNLNSFQ